MSPQFTTENLKGRSPTEEYRCGCGKMLFKARMVLCLIEIKCQRCGAMCRFEAPNDDRPRIYEI